MLVVVPVVLLILLCMIIPTSTLSSNNFFNNIIKSITTSSTTNSNININSMYTNIWVGDNPTPSWSDLDRMLTSTEQREERTSFTLMREGS